MSLPNLPVFYDMPYTNKEGKLTTESSLYNDNLWQTLNKLVEQVNNGWRFPIKTDAEILVYKADVNIPIGTTWISSDLGKLVFKNTTTTTQTVTSA